MAYLKRMDSAELIRNLEECLSEGSEREAFGRLEELIDKFASSKYLERKAKEKRKIEFEDSLVDAFKVSFSLLSFDDCKWYHQLDLFVIDDKIYGLKNLEGYPDLFNHAKIRDGCFYFNCGRFNKKLYLIDNFSTIINEGYRITVTINKVKVSLSMIENL